MKQDYMLIDKNSLRKLTTEDISIERPELKNLRQSKSTVLANWFEIWIMKDLTSGEIKETDLMPNKAELAYYLGVSVGTIQNALRVIEDKGYVVSKQCLGTMVKNPKNESTKIKKLTSKRDVAIEAIKDYITGCKLKVGEPLPSYRALAEIIKISPNTTRLALESLCSAGIVIHEYERYKDGTWVLHTENFAKKDYSNDKTLVEKIEKELKAYIQNNLKAGDKMPSHSELSKEFKVSIKTVHDGLERLIKEGILLTRRGRYGTSVIRLPESAESVAETSIFAPAQEAMFYHWERTYTLIKNMISRDYEINSKLPSILELSKRLDLSPNTIRKAFAKLSAEGYLKFVRGRWGGTFVADIPEETASENYKWLAVNSQYAELYK